MKTKRNSVLLAYLFIYIAIYLTTPRPILLKLVPFDLFC